MPDSVPPTARGAVFLSYAREDTDATRRIATALRNHGIEVWFDQNELRGGEAWDQDIRRQIRECALFLPLISANTQQRPEGYFRLEWHLAEQRSLTIARGRPFLVPVSLDATSERGALVPESFLAVQWTRLPNGVATTEFVERITNLLAGRETASRSAAVAPRPAAGPLTPANPGPPPAHPAGAAPPLIPDYDLLRRVGQGAYGEVWLARSLTGLLRAVKIVRRESFADAAPYEREFNGLREFAAHAQASTDQLALLHVGQNEAEGFFYYVMELADDVDRGRDIDPARYVPLTFKELRARRGRLPAAECLTLAVALARALAALHSRGLVHRDIKPSNIIVVSGAPKLADIGLVASADEARSFVGTEGFVPPEGPGAAAGDVFAFGYLIYELLTGLDHRDFPKLPDELSKLPDHRALLELNQIVLRACDTDRTQRYPDGAALLHDLLLLQAGRSLRHRRVRSLALWLGAAAATATVVLLGLSLAAHRSARPTPAAQPPPDFAAAKSVAVLPFANRSADKENAFFADGVHEDLLTNLSYIGDLRVVSRTSVEQYRGTAKTLKQIGLELGVAYILEGSVQRAGNKVHVTGQLIDARTDAHLWAKSYDKDISDVFAIQVELATAIAAELQAVLSPREKKLVTQKLTDNPQAYDLLIKARQVYRSARPNISRPQAELLYQAAISLDPKFVTAWYELLDIHRFAYAQSQDHTSARLARAREARDRVVSLAPDSPTAMAAIGMFSFLTRDYTAALEQYKSLAHLQPKVADWQFWIGTTSQRMGGHWPESVAALRKAEELDLENAISPQNLMQTLEAGRRYPEAEAKFRRWLVKSPKSAFLISSLAQLAFYARGSISEAEKIMDQIPGERANSQAGIEVRKDWAFSTGNLDEFLRLEQLKPNDAPADWVSNWTPGLEAAVVRAAKGDLAGARAALPSPAARVKRLESEPENGAVLAALAENEVLLGQKEEALRHARRAVELDPESADAFYGPLRSITLAFVYAWTGDKDRAIAEYARLLRLPNIRTVAHLAGRNGLNVHEMKLSPLYLPLRGDPRFEALLADPKNNEPLF